MSRRIPPSERRPIQLRLIPIHELKTIRVAIKRKNISPNAEDGPLIRTLDNIDDLVLHHAGEGEKPIFDRDDILVNLDFKDRIVVSDRTPENISILTRDEDECSIIHCRNRHSRSNSRARSPGGRYYSRSRTRSRSKDTTCHRHGSIENNFYRSQQDASRNSKDTKSRRRSISTDRRRTVSPPEREHSKYRREDTYRGNRYQFERSERTPSSSKHIYKYRRDSRSPTHKRDTNRRTRPPIHERESSRRSRSPGHKRDSNRRSRSPIPRRDTDRRSRTPIAKRDSSRRSRSPIPKHKSNRRSRSPIPKHNSNRGSRSPYKDRDKYRDYKKRSRSPYPSRDKYRSPPSKNRRDRSRSPTTSSRYRTPGDSERRRNPPAPPYPMPQHFGAPWPMYEAMPPYVRFVIPDGFIPGPPRFPGNVQIRPRLPQRPLPVYNSRPIPVRSGEATVTKTTATTSDSSTTATSKEPVIHSNEEVTRVGE